MHVNKEMQKQKMSFFLHESELAKSVCVHLATLAIGY